MSKYLGDVSAYAYAVSKGYTGTEEEFAELMASYASVAEAAAESAQAAASSASDANASKTAAGQSEANAAQSAEDADDAKTAAINAKNAADGIRIEVEAFKTAALGSATQASQSAIQAANSAQSANLSATDANTAKTGAEEAQGKAEEAQSAAETAQSKAEDAQSEAEQAAQSISESAEQIETNKQDISDIKADLLQVSAQVRVIAARDDSWSAIRENVKMGFGELLYPVGTEFEVTCPTGAPYSSIIFVVVDHRVESNEHIMTLLMKHVIYSTEFDAIQAIICPTETMVAGTYHFALLSGYDTDHDGGKTVQFTLANDLEAGGQIVMSWPYNQTWIGRNLTVYHAFGTSAIETCVMSEGVGGTDLGAADGTVSILNHTHRARYASNNYKESAIREWLNSDGAANAWQTQQTRFQRPCSYRTRAGFVTYLDPEFVAVIREGLHPNRTNEVFDLNGKKQAYSTTDKFFLASQEEIGFLSESGIVCGSVFDYYNGASQADKIKYDIAAQTTARYWWLRTPYPYNASVERIVYSSGAFSSYYASVGLGAAAACEI